MSNFVLLVISLASLRLLHQSTLLLGARLHAPRRIANAACSCRRTLVIALQGTLLVEEVRCFLRFARILRHGAGTTTSLDTRARHQHLHQPKDDMAVVRVTTTRLLRGCFPTTPTIPRLSISIPHTQSTKTLFDARVWPALQPPTTIARVQAFATAPLRASAPAHRQRETLRALRGLAC